MSIEIKNKLSTKGRYRPEIDGLRAFAVVTVIINHFNKDILPGGYLGVDIFFVISGFVITSSLYQRPSKNFKDFIIGFYERRIKRLVPALSVFVLVSSIMICLFNPFPGFSLKTGLASLFGLSNLYLFKESTDYFAKSTELNVFTHTWSLGVEEQFYILFPLLIWFSGFGRATKNGARNLSLIIGTLAITSLIGFLYLYPIDQPAAYFLMPTRFWEMATGCLLFIALERRVTIKRYLEKVPPPLVLVLIVGVMYIPLSMASTSTIAVVFLTSILIASLKKETASFKVLTNPKVVYIGLISYSLYLWHWVVLSISRWTIGIHWWSVIFQLALMLGLAIASYQYLETPLRKDNWCRKRWKTIVVGSGVIFTLSGGLIVLARPLKGKLYVGMRVSKSSFSYGRSNFIEPNLSPEFSSKNCHLNGLDLKSCYLQVKGAKTVFFLGDSHSNHYRQSAFLLHKNFNIGVFSITTGWCNFPLHTEQFSKSNCNNLQKKFNTQKKIGKYLDRNASEGDIVIVSNRYPINYSGKAGSRSNKWLESEKSIKNINKLFESLSKNGSSLVLFLPSPEFKQFSFFCKKEWFRLENNDCAVNKKIIIKKQSKARELVHKYLDPRIHVYDPVPHLCDQKCKVIDSKGNYLYTDNNHISDYSSENYIYPSLILFLQDLKLL